MSSVNEQMIPPSKPRISPLEFRNTDLVSRLLAATPPYLYNMSLLPNSYFFSEMLRSFVQAKKPSTVGSQFQSRRGRKRPWSSLRPETSTTKGPSSKLDLNLFGPKLNEVPLELTTEKTELKAPEQKPETDVLMQEPMEGLYSVPQDTSNLILPPPPPIWYPPLYPTTTPYGIDPLHFFIDLRVSGHIYDRKNREFETPTSPKTEEPKPKNPKEAFKQSRHTSAFSVPTPRGGLNLNQQEHNFEVKKFDVKSMGFDRSVNKIGTSYVMNHLTHIYKDINQKSVNVKFEETTQSEDSETPEEREKRVRDLRALIGLELVVDYMNHAKPQPRKWTDVLECPSQEPLESPTLEVVALHDET